MKTLILAAAAAAATLVGGAAMAQPYGYAHSYDRGAYSGYSGYGYNNARGSYAYADRDRYDHRYDNGDRRHYRYERQHRYDRDHRYDHDRRW